MKPIIKKIKNGLKILTINLLMVGTILSTTSCSNPSFENFNSDDDIISIAEKLDCDISYLKEYRDNYVRMQHNGDEPIYVCFDADLTEKEKESSIKEAFILVEPSSIPKNVFPDLIFSLINPITSFFITSISSFF